MSSYLENDDLVGPRLRRCIPELLQFLFGVGPNPVTPLSKYSANLDTLQRLASGFQLRLWYRRTEGADIP